MGKDRFYTIKIVITIILVIWYWGTCVKSSCFAREDAFWLYNKGVEYYHTGKLYKAKEKLQEVVRLYPTNEDAQVYLALVNADLEMTVPQPRRLPLQATYEVAEVVSSDNPEVSELGIDSDNPGYGEPQPEDKLKTMTALNERISPSEIKGEYKMALGFTPDDVIWKKANGDYNERNFRMIDHNYPKVNTFDTRVYDRFKVQFDTNKAQEGLNFHSDITVDPWSFVGKTDKFTVTSNAGTDRVEMEYKYWSGMRGTINEIYYTNDLGDGMATSEYKVSDGKVPAFSISSNWSNFAIPEKEIDFIFQPIRELWFDYDKDDYKLRVFPFGLEDQALSSDDPLGLSNHHIYWEPSPWLDEWVPGHINTGAVPEDFWQGRWSDDLSFFTRDSDLTRLTALRGVSFQGKLFDSTELLMTAATAKGLWQDYESVTALPGAIRTKTHITDELMIGAIDTFRIGYSDVTKAKTDSFNNVFGIDLSYDFNPTTNIVSEWAMSESEYDRTTGYTTGSKGTLAHLAIKKKTGLGDARLAFSHMDEGFDPGLANYKETRNDQFWGRHIHFKEPSEHILVTKEVLKYEDIEPFRIGDGIDVGRNAFNFRFDTKDALEGKMDNLIDYRYVRDSEHKYVEGVFRDENTFRLNPEWTSKLLFLYHDLPKTKGGIDPIKYDSDTGEFLRNVDVEDGKDPSVSTYSLGLEYAPEDWISIFGIYENTNDYKFSTGDYPNGLLNSSYFTTATVFNIETLGGNRIRKEQPFLYSQDYFDLPPYERFNIYRTGISLKPTKDLGIDFDYTKNDFKFAQSIDDNMNHFGTSLKYKFNCKLTGFLKYTYSKAYNLYRLNTSGDLKYEDHHNVYLKLDYNVSQYGLLTIEFGEGAFLAPMVLTGYSPFGNFYPTLDTQHIVRVYYQGVF